MTVLSFLVIIACQLRFFALRTWHPLRKRKAMASVAGPAARLLSAPVGGGTGSGVLTETCLPNWTYSSGMLWKSFFSRSYVSFSFLFIPAPLDPAFFTVASASQQRFPVRDYKRGTLRPMVQKHAIGRQH
jgi:hypothetical protein